MTYTECAPVSLQGQTCEIGGNRRGELTGRLYEEITAIQTGEIEDRHQWNMLVPLETSPEIAISATG